MTNGDITLSVESSIFLDITSENASFGIVEKGVLKNILFIKVLMGGGDDHFSTNYSSLSVSPESPY